MTTTQVFAAKKAIESAKCIETAKVVLFTKASVSMELNFKELIQRKKLNGLYSDFEAQTILENKQENYPTSLCDESLILSLGEYSKTLEKSCSHQDIEFTVKDFSLELLNEISTKKVKSLFNLSKINKRKMDSIINNLKTKDCSNKKHRDEITSLELSITARPLCHKIIRIINSIKNNC